MNRRYNHNSSGVNIRPPHAHFDGASRLRASQGAAPSVAISATGASERDRRATIMPSTAPSMPSARKGTPLLSVTGLAYASRAACTRCRTAASRSRRACLPRPAGRRGGGRRPRPLRPDAENRGPRRGRQGEGRGGAPPPLRLDAGGDAAGRGGARRGDPRAGRRAGRRVSHGRLALGRDAGGLRTRFAPSSSRPPWRSARRDARPRLSAPRSPNKPPRSPRRWRIRRPERRGSGRSTRAAARSGSAAR